MNSNPLVSVIINNFNYCTYLSEAIHSALDQTYRHIEVIVVDDGSTDSSPDIIHSFHKKIISFIKSNAGQASCFNEGFKRSIGDIIIFLDADDFLANTAAEKAVEAMTQPDIVKVHWPMFKVDDKGKWIGGKLPDDKMAEGDLRQQVIEFGPAKCGGPPNSPPTSGNAWSRSYLNKVLPMPELPFRNGADNYLFVLAPVYGVIKSIDESLSYYRVHGSNNTLKRDYMEKYFDRFEHCCVALSKHLEHQGIHISSAHWPRDHWYHRLYADIQCLGEYIPKSEAFILVDENQWMSGEDILGRKRILFTEKNGVYWGPPASDNAAIKEMESDREKGAGYIVFTWPAFWWLEHYRDFTKYLDTMYDCIVQNERMTIYDLRNQNSTS